MQRSHNLHLRINIKYTICYLRVNVGVFEWTKMCVSVVYMKECRCVSECRYAMVSIDMYELMQVNVSEYMCMNECRCVWMDNGGFVDRNLTVLLFTSKTVPIPKWIVSLWLQIILINTLLDVHNITKWLHGFDLLVVYAFDAEWVQFDCWIDSIETWLLSSINKIWMNSF